MKKQVPIYLSIFAGLVTFVFVSCFDSPTAKSDGGTRTVSGRLLGSNNSAVSGAIVRMAPANYAPSFSASSSGSVSVDTTDTQGNYQIAVAGSGTYSLDAQKDTLGIFVDSIKISSDSTNIHAPDFKMKKLGMIIGVSNMAGQTDTNQIRVTLYLAGTERITKPAVGGSFSFANVPEGRYQLIIDPTLDQFNVKIIDVSISSGQTLDVGIVKLSSAAAVSQPPSNLSYLTPVYYATGSPITDNVPTVSGTGITYTISPPLPAGMLFYAATGIISGKPTLAVAAANYTVTATNGIGSTNAVVRIETYSAPPTNLSYPSPISYAIGDSVARITPSITGTVTRYSISPSLPAGLSIDPRTGIISGIPAASSLAADYTVAASNDLGSSNFVVNMAIDWTVQSSKTPNLLNSVAWTGSQLVAVGWNRDKSAGAILLSANGTVWTSRNASAPTWLMTVIWAGTQLVALGDTAILTSPDGITWTTRFPGHRYGLLSVTWTGSQLVAVGNSYAGEPSAILTSPDGITWTSRNSGTIEELESVTWTGSKLVAVSFEGSIFTSPDGVAWTSKYSAPARSSSGAFQGLRSVIWTGAQLVAVGGPSTGTILTSSDGEVWTTRYTSNVYHLNSVALVGSKLVAVGWSSSSTPVQLTSSNGITWTNRLIGLSGEFDGMAWTGTRLIAVGRNQENGIILSSP